MKTNARTTCAPEVCAAIRTLRATLATHYHVGDFQFHVEAFGHVIAEWDSVRGKEVMPVARDDADAEFDEANPLD